MVWANPYEAVLSNGLKMIVKEDHRSPTAVHMVWYRAGSMDETSATTGVAHVLEHMMFKGTLGVPAGEFSKRVAAAGGRDNAFTSRDYTAYFQIVPKAALPEMMALEADRMHRLRVSSKEFDPEIKVVMEERRLRTEDNPRSLVAEALYAVAFTASPYRWPIIGWMQDLRNMTWMDAQAWYQLWYTPANAVLVVVGDVDHRQVFDWARKTYGKIPAKTLPRRREQVEPEQKGLRRVSVKAPAQLPYLMLGWKVPRLTDVDRDTDPYALQVLAAVLAGHDAARLPRHLVREKKIAQSADAGYDPTLRGESVFILDADPAQGVSVRDLESALREEVRRIQDAGVDPKELERVKNQLVASQVYKRDSMMAQAIEMGALEMVGHSWKNIDKMIEKLSAITPQAVQDVARKYLIDDTLTIAQLDPQPPGSDQAGRAQNPLSAHIR